MAGAAIFGVADRLHRDRVGAKLHLEERVVAHVALVQHAVQVVRKDGRRKPFPAQSLGAGIRRFKKYRFPRCGKTI